MAYNRTLGHFTSSQELATQWETAQSYIVDQIVIENNIIYICDIAHTSGVFATDLSAGKWSALTAGVPVTIANGGTGQTTQQTAINALTGTQTAGHYLRSDGTNAALSSIQAADVPTLNQNTTGTASNVTGVVAILNGGTGQTTQTAAFDALAPTTTAGDLIVHNGTDNVRQGIGTDGQVLVVDTAQTNKLKWATIQQGSKNYIANSTFENGVTPPSSWSTFSTTIDSTTKIPTGSVTSDPTITLATSSSTPLAGTYSMLASSGAVTITTTGYGFISSAFTIDKEDQAKVMGFSFYYEAVSGTMNFSGTSSNTFAVYIRDVSGGAWIQPAGAYNLVQSSGSGICSGTFQTTATGTQYQIAVLMINTVSAAVSMRFDDFQLGPQKVLAGAATSDWVSSTPTYSNAGTTSLSVLSTRRVGDTLEIQGRTVFSSSGAAAVLTLTIPPSIGVIDTTKVNTGNVGGCVGNFLAFFAGTNFGGAVTLTTTANQVSFAPDGSPPGGALNGSNLGAGSQLSYKLAVPIQGWSSNTVMSQDTDTRVVAFSVYPAVAQPALTSGVSTKVLFDTINFPDTHGAFDFSNDWYRVPVSGYYNINATVAFPTNNVGARAVGYRIDGSFVRWMSSYQASTGDFTRCTGSAIAYLNAGSYVEIFAFQNSGGALGIVTGADFTQFSMNRLSGPATIAASEKLACSYNTSTSVIAGLATWSQVTYTNKLVDTHGIYNTSTGVATIPVSGVYRITHQMRGKNVLNGSEYLAVHFSKNGTAFANNLTFSVLFGATGLSFANSVGPATWVGTLLAGDLIRFSMDSNSASNGPATGASDQLGNIFTIELI